MLRIHERIGIKVVHEAEEGCISTTLPLGNQLECKNGYCSQICVKIAADATPWASEFMQSFRHFGGLSFDAGTSPAGWVRAILAVMFWATVGAVMAQTPQSQIATAAVPRAGEVVFVAGTVVRRNASGIDVGLAKGSELREGDRIEARGDGYVYVRMADGGLLVVRPLSELRIDRWHFDPTRPAQTEIRYTLNSGVARYVSGEGSKAAKDKFRFNTPLAAIGVRGTDFTVFSDPTYTRVVVRTGGVVVSLLGTGSCRAEALGPCEGDVATELFASAREKMIQIRQGDARPELVDINVAPTPDKARPPLPAEPVASSRPAAATSVAIEDFRTQKLATTSSPQEQTPPEILVVAPPSPAPSPTPAPAPAPVVQSINAVWGRTASVHGSEVPRVLLDDILAGRSLIASNRYYTLAGDRSGEFTLPNAGSAEFKLVAHQGVIVDKVSNRASDSVASNGSLRIDFANRLFSTSFDLQSKDISAHIEGKGSINSDGAFLSAPFKSPTLVKGLVGGPGASEAAFVYQQTLSKQFDAAGVASWGR